MEDYKLVKEFEKGKYVVKVFSPTKTDEEKLHKTLEFLEKVAKEKSHNP